MGGGRRTTTGGRAALGPGTLGAMLGWAEIGCRLEGKGRKAEGKAALDRAKQSSLARL